MSAFSVESCQLNFQAVSSLSELTEFSLSTSIRSVDPLCILFCFTDISRWILLPNTDFSFHTFTRGRMMTPGDKWPEGSCKRSARRCRQHRRVAQPYRAKSSYISFCINRPAPKQRRVTLVSVCAGAANLYSRDQIRQASVQSSASAAYTTPVNLASLSGSAGIQTYRSKNSK